MGDLTRSQLEASHPESLTGLADSWRKTGASIESLFNRYAQSVNQANGSYWEGSAAEAAQHRADADRKAAVKAVDALDQLADTATQGYHAVDAAKRAAVEAIHAAEAAGFVVEEDFLVHESLADVMLDGLGDSSAAARRKQDLANFANEIAGAVAAFRAADSDVAGKLTGQRSELIAKFTDAGSLSGDQGSGDGKNLMNDPSHLNAEEQQRLKEAGQLSPQQLADLQSGKTVTIPASQMEYMNTLSHSMDGKSPQEIKAIMDKLSPESRQALGNIFQIGSTKTVTASVEGNKDVPTNGGLSVLPKKMGESLTRKDLVSGKWNTSSPYSSRTVSLNGVKDNQTIAAIAGAGDHNYQAGSELDHSLANVGAQYLHAQVQAEQGPDHKSVGFEVDGRGQEPGEPVTENIFSNIGHDKTVVSDMVSDPHTGMQFIKDIETHNWSDNGSAAGKMFDFKESDFNDARTGKIMESFMRANSDNKSWALADAIPGTDGKSVGELNPELLRTLARNSGPYVGAMTGDGSLPGFSIDGWADSDGSGKYVGAQNVFSLFNTDKPSAEMITASALNHKLGALNEYAQNPTGADSGADIIAAGRAQALVNRGALQAAHDDYGKEAEQEAYDRKSKAFEMLTGVAKYSAGKLPLGGSEITAALNIGGDGLKGALIGPAPSHKIDPDALELSGPTERANYMYVLQKAGQLDPSITHDFPWARGDDGHIRSYESMKEEYVKLNPTKKFSDDIFTNAVDKMFNKLNNDHDAGLLKEYYDTIVGYRDRH